LNKNLDDNFDEFEKGEDEPRYTLTPKGLLLVALMESKTVSKNLNTDDVDLMMNIANETWIYFENQVRKWYGDGDNISAAVFDNNGGRFVSLRASNDDDDEMEDDVT